jgi:hypothetical protein
MAKKGVAQAGNPFYQPGKDGYQALRSRAETLAIFPCLLYPVQ